MGKERIQKKERHNPLHVQLAEDELPNKKRHKEKYTTRRQERDEEDVLLFYFSYLFIYCKNFIMTMFYIKGIY